MFIFEKELEDMTLDELKDVQEKLQHEIDLMDENEPQDPASEEFADWAEQHEDLEDIMDDIIDLLEALS